jgi:hypothetical protein
MTPSTTAPYTLALYKANRLSVNVHIMSTFALFVIFGVNDGLRDFVLGDLKSGFRDIVMLHPVACVKMFCA